MSSSALVRLVLWFVLQLLISEAAGSSGRWGFAFVLATTLNLALYVVPAVVYRAARK